MIERFTDNQRVKIQYWVLKQSPAKIPVIIVPGALSDGTHIYEAIKPFAAFYTIIVNLRGRGKSDIPVSGYSSQDQVSDIEAVIAREHLSKFFLFGHSVGAGLASLCAIRNHEKVQGLIIADYPPAYPKFTEKWVERVSEHFPDVNKNLINGMFSDSKKEYYLDALNEFSFPKLIIKGGKEDSLLTDEKAREINEKLKFSSLKVIKDSGHEVFFEAPAETMRLVDNFVA